MSKKEAVSNSTWTFIENTGQIEITVKQEFQDELKKNNVVIKDNVPDCTSFELFTKYNMKNFLHNPIGPALTIIKPQHKAFFINGTELDLPQAKKLLNDASFHKDVDALVETA